MANSYPYKRASGFERLRERIHRKRHRHQKESIVDEIDESFEMSSFSSTVPSASSSSSSELRIRSEKSIPTIVPVTPINHLHHHRHHRKKNKTINQHQHVSSKNRREKNEELCQNQRKTIELNTQSHEFDPPFVVEVRCLNTPSIVGFGFGKEQTCMKGMLRCVQQYSDVHVSRRGVNSVHWHPYTIPDVPISCQCMWPVDRYGHQEF